MANVRPSSTVGDIRGKLGQEVYARNSAGLYVRSLGSWVQPDTQRQVDARAAITALSQAWSGTLTEANRNSWRSYARRWPMPNTWGDLILTTGYNYFVRCNAYRYRQNTSIDFQAAPNAGPLSPPVVTFTTDPGNDQLTVIVPPVNYAPPSHPLRLWLFVGLQQTQGVHFYAGPWRYVAENLWSGAWASDPWTVASPWTLDIDKRLWLYVAAQDSVNGQLSRQYYAQTDT